MTRLYSELGATYGAHEDRTYGTLFDPAQDEAPTTALVVLFARVDRNDVLADVTTLPIVARTTTLPIDIILN